MSKSGSPKKRRASMKHGATRASRDVRAHAEKMRDNAALLLRVVAHLVQNSPQIAARFTEHGDARIPLDALSTDVDVGMVVEDGFLVIAPAPLPPSEDDFEPLTAQMVIDVLGLASKHATRADVEAWPHEQWESAFEWAAREHMHASDNPDVQRLPEPEHVRALPNIEGHDPSGTPGGEWITRLRWPDGRTTAFAQVPGQPETRREVET